MLTSLKHMLLDSIFYRYNIEQHIEEDRLELEKNANNLDLTKKDYTIAPKFLHYQTFYQKLQDTAKEVSAAPFLFKKLHF